ncbi:hypothetical protein QSV37_05175 [Acinetobacter sp. VNK23]|uniref:hypothetical protein n=1 Tax=Acinetobacter thutiue TaxID=2998078 RepID=UPI0025786F1F|nr:hypothetical protein [Acinetobacter thutiue]MDM1019704.1 hypothetical protein [Acinetobacter thutiue]
MTWFHPFAKLCESDKKWSDMDNSKERQAYRDWFSSAFNKNEIEFLSSIGVECEADHKFFKFEILDIFDYLRNYKLKKNSALYDKVVDRLIVLLPKYIQHQVDRELLKDDQYYLAWFFNRHCFFERINEAKKEAEKSTDYSREYLLWSPIIDINCPEECKVFNNKTYHVLDKSFIEAAVDHWANIKRGCRCALMALTKAQVNKRQSRE